jgi:urease accessory protein
MRFRARILSLAAGVAAAGWASAALAHPGHAAASLGLAAGFAHPLSGYDHVLAMTVVGLWAALRGGKAFVVWPSAFLAAMAAGFHVGGIGGAMVEPGVVASMVLLGLLTAANRPGGGIAGLIVVAAAGTLHGMAHAGDIGMAAPAFGAGMLAATALLHGLGMAFAASLRRIGRENLVRWLGAGVAASGLLLAVAG